jgi:hypothetical protein
MSTHNCFWCDKVLYKQQKTKDHLFSTFIRERFQPENKQIICFSCYNCNQDRGHISSIFQFVYRFKNNDWEGVSGIPEKKNMKRIIKRLNRCVDIFKFREKASKLKDDEAKKLCLMEIDEVISFDHRMISHGH